MPLKPVAKHASQLVQEGSSRVLLLCRGLAPVGSIEFDYDP